MIGRDGRTTAFEFDALGNLTKQTRPDGSEIRMAYDPVGFLTDLWDADNRHTQWSIDDTTGTITKTYADASQWITRRGKRRGKRGQSAQCTNSMRKKGSVRAMHKFY